MTCVPGAQWAGAVAALAIAGAALNLAGAGLQSYELYKQVDSKNKYNTTDSVSNSSKYATT
jgi:hypothetical protein